MTGSVVPPTTISGEAIEAAARAIYADELDRLPADERATVIRWFSDGLAAAVPYIEAGLREQLATEIEATQHGPGILAGDFKRPAQHFNAGIRAAARVARGTQEATK